MLIIFRASHGHWHMWVYPTRMFWGLKHPPNLNWKEWTVLLADLTFACIRVKLVTSVITHFLLPFIPLVPINPEKCGPDFISFLISPGESCNEFPNIYMLQIHLMQRCHSGSRLKKYTRAYCVWWNLYSSWWSGTPAQVDGCHWES